MRNLRPAALIALPLMTLAATALILVLLVVAGPEVATDLRARIEQRLRHCFCPALAVDPRNCQIVAANEEATELFGPAQVTAGTDPSELLADGAAVDWHRVLSTAVNEGEAQIDACNIRTRSGEARVVHVRASRYATDARQVVVIGFVGNEADKAITGFARVQERLMSSISHELRTPLNVVLGFSELLTTGTLGELTESQIDAAEECHIGGERILRLVTDILDVGRCRSYYMSSPPTPFEPGEMVRRIETLLVGQARRADIKLEVDVPADLPQLEADERGFKQLLYHLILSSLDRSTPGERVNVAAEADEMLTMIVTDSGPPAPDDELRPRTQQPLPADRIQYPLAPPVLGLPLCATLAARLGGSLSCRSDEEGTHFVLQLPFRPDSDDE